MRPSTSSAIAADELVRTCWYRAVTISPMVLRRGPSSDYHPMIVGSMESASTSSAGGQARGWSTRGGLLTSTNETTQQRPTGVSGPMSAPAVLISAGLPVSSGSPNRAGSNAIAALPSASTATGRPGTVDTGCAMRGTHEDLPTSSPASRSSGPAPADRNASTVSATYWRIRFSNSARPSHTSD
jgi:hypothetical protein